MDLLFSHLSLRKTRVYTVRISKASGVESLICLFFLKASYLVCVYDMLDQFLL